MEHDDPAGWSVPLGMLSGFRLSDLDGDHKGSCTMEVAPTPVTTQLDVTQGVQQSLAPPMAGWHEA